MDSSEKYAFKIVVIGDPEVGKTSLIRRFSNNSFDENYKATAGADFYIKILKINDLNIFLTIWDIGAQERFGTIRNYYYSGADAAILVYDVTNSKSLDSLKSWDDDFLKASIVSNPRIIVGNKIDLLDKDELKQDKALQFAHDRNLKLILTSAKNNFNVEKIFVEISKLCLEKYNLNVIYK